jgi:ABC-type multidrug transport system permease subunit
MRLIQTGAISILPSSILLPQKQKLGSFYLCQTSLIFFFQLYNCLLYFDYEKKRWNYSLYTVQNQLSTLIWLFGWLKFLITTYEYDVSMYGTNNFFN